MPTCGEDRPGTFWAFLVAPSFFLCSKNDTRSFRSNSLLFSSLDISSYSTNTGNADPAGHSPREGPNEQDCGATGCGGSRGAGSVCLLQEGEPSGSPPEKEAGSVSQRGWRTPGERGPLNQLCKGHASSQRLKASTGPARVCTRVSANVLLLSV